MSGVSAGPPTPTGRARANTYSISKVSPIPRVCGACLIYGYPFVALRSPLSSDGGLER